MIIGEKECVLIHWQERHEFYQWCEDNEISASYEGSYGFNDAWCIHDDALRIIATLRWA